MEKGFQFVGFCNTEVPGVPAGATSTDLQMCHQDWQRHLGCCLLCAASHAQAGDGTCSSLPLLAPASHPCKGAFSVILLPCSPGFPQPAFLPTTKEAPLTPQPCWPITAPITPLPCSWSYLWDRYSLSQCHLRLLNHTGKSINLKLLLCTRVNYYQTYN